MMVHTKKNPSITLKPVGITNVFPRVKNIFPTRGLIPTSLSVVRGFFLYEPKGIGHPSNLATVIAALRMCMRCYTIADYILLEKLIYLYFHVSQLIFLIIRLE